MKNNSKHITIKDIARLSNTSHATVSRVLSNSGYPVSAETRKRVMKAVKELNYIPNLIGRSLKTRNNLEIGVMVPNISNPYYASLVLGIEETLSEHNYNVLLCNSHRNPHKEESILENFMMKQVSGVIISSITKNYKLLDEMKRKNIAIVAVDQDLEGFECSKVTFEYVKSGYLATEHLIKNGHKKIAYISSPLDRLSRKNLFEGYVQALKKYNIPLDDKLLGIAATESESANTSFEFKNGHDMMMNLLKNKNIPTAVFACNDMTAFGVMEAIRKSGLKIPDDIAVIGCDNLLISSISNPGLSTIDEPVYEMSKVAANLLLDKLKGNEKEISIVLQPSLVVRESTSKSV